MLQSINLPLCPDVLAWYGGVDGLRRDIAALGMDGVEGIYDGFTEPAGFPPDLLTGYHLTFFPDWVDFYRGDEAALVEKFGSLDAARDFYGGDPGRDTLLNAYRQDLRRAVALGAQYVVFHVSDVSIEEGYTYLWRHTDREVADAAIEAANSLLDSVLPTFDFLVENLWWPGFTFTDPTVTRRLLTEISYPRVGVLLDTGHLLNTNWSLRNQSQALAYIHAMLDRHGALTENIWGLHLHQSISGAYAKAHVGKLPDDLPRDYVERFTASYGHITSIDRHRPWTHPGVAGLVERVHPRYLTHELSAASRRDKLAKTRRQLTALEKGGLAPHAH